MPYTKDGYFYLCIEDGEEHRSAKEHNICVLKKTRAIRREYGKKPIGSMPFKLAARMGGLESDPRNKPKLFRARAEEP